MCRSQRPSDDDHHVHLDDLDIDDVDIHHVHFNDIDLHTSDHRRRHFGAGCSWPRLPRSGRDNHDHGSAHHDDDRGADYDHDGPADHHDDS